MFKTGCPHKHPAKIREIRSWKDEKSEKRKGLTQAKFKVQFKPPAGVTEGWRILLKFGYVYLTIYLKLDLCFFFVLSAFI